MSGSQFRRYTKLPYLMSMLNEGMLALRDPSNWEDKNDVHFLKLYKTKKELKSLLVLCFAEAPETYLHWKIFTYEDKNKNEGVCIGFNKARLLKKADKDKSLVHDYVAYKTIKEMRTRGLAIEDLPFLKRYAYVDEQEYRIIYKSPDEILETKYIQIVPDDIEFIDINPWAKETEINAMKLQIKSVRGFENIRLRPSTITDNSGWKQLGESAIEGKRKHYRRRLNPEYQK